MEKIKVLFVCIHNSARSQIAEAFMNKYHGDKFIAESAGYEPSSLNPLVVKSLQEVGIDISGKSTNRVFDYFKEGRFYSYVITVCDESNAERCPIFPGVVNTIHWSFPDPSQFKGTDEEKLEQIRSVRDEIKRQIDEWVLELKV
jgi:arsenate reductase (thioredoxin)